MKPSGVRHKCAQIFRAMGETSLLRFSALDVSVVLGVCAFIVAWKFLSLDYSAFQDLLPGVPLYSYSWGWVNALADSIHRFFIAIPSLIHVVQIGAALLIVVGALRLSKVLLIPGLIGVIAVELVAIQFRAFLYDMDIPVAALLIAMLFSWQPLTKPTCVASSEATRIGLALAAFIGCAYLLAGWSKFSADPLWFMHTRLDLLYPVMDVWHSIRFTPWMEPIAKGLSQLFAAAPLIGTIASLVTILSEFFWWTSLLSRWARLTISFIMLASHLLIFLGSGILFFSWAAIAIALVMPWRAFRSPASDSAATAASKAALRFDYKLALAILAGLAIPLTPTLLGGGLLPFPMARYDIFGWSYATLEGKSTAHRLGYRDPVTGQLAVIPIYHGGFFDFRSITGPALEIQSLATAAKPELATESCNRLGQYVRALRDFGSDGWLLGPLQHPHHLVAASKAVDPDLITEPLLLRGDWIVTGTTANVTWQQIGSVERAADGAISCHLDSSP